MCTGRPSADASRRLSPVTMAQEKSRPVVSTAERPARSRVLVISRTMASNRLAITASWTGSSGAGYAARLRPLDLGLRSATPRGGRGRPADGEQVVVVAGDPGRAGGIQYDRGGGLFDDRGTMDGHPRGKRGAPVDGRVQVALVREERRPVARNGSGRS